MTEEFRLTPVVDGLKKYLKCTVAKADDCIGPDVRAASPFASPVVPCVDRGGRCRVVTVAVSVAIRLDALNVFIESSTDCDCCVGSLAR